MYYSKTILVTLLSVIVSLIIAVLINKHELIYLNPKNI